MPFDPSTLDRLTDREIAELVRHSASVGSRKRNQDYVALVCADASAPGPPPPAPMLWGYSVGGQEGWAAVERGIAKGGPMQVLRTYAAGGGTAQAEKGAQRYPGVPLIHGPKSLDWTNDQRKKALDVYARLKEQAGGRIWITPDPEHDRHILKSGWTMGKVLADWERWATLAGPVGLAGDLWVNPTGYLAEQRFGTYVDPIVPFAAGLGVDAYPGKADQAGLADITWAAKYAEGNGLGRIALMECGVKAETPNRENVYRSMLATAKQVGAVMYVEWNTAEPGVADTIPSDAMWAAFREARAG